MRRDKKQPAEDTLIDYNGQGEWSADSLRRRYRQYASELRVSEPADLAPRESVQGERRWVYPVMSDVIAAIERKDPAAVRIGIEFIEQDQHFRFGRILKSNTARALRRAPLTADQEERIRRRIVHMLVAGQVPHEYKEYAKLLRRVGVGDWWPFVESRADLVNPYVRRYYDYLRRHPLAPPG